MPRNAPASSRPVTLSSSSPAAGDTTLGEHQCAGFWLYAEQGESFTFGAAAPGGGGDLDILWWWVPGYGWANYSVYTGVNDALSVTAPVAGFYDFYLCNYPGNGVCNGALTASGGRHEVMGDMRGTGRNTPPDGTDVNLDDGATSFDEWLDAYASVFADGFETGDTSQWSTATP